MTIDLRAVPGVAETDLSESLFASLPAGAPPAPWDCTCEAILWLTHADGSAARAQTAVPGRNLVVIGGFVRYLDTPVGPYNEVLGTVGVLQDRSVTATVPFMAVDSRDSLVGGRQNWSLPKTLATFTGAPLDARMSASGDGWAVSASARAVGPNLPTRLSGRLAQDWPDGVLRDAALRGKGRVRPALVTVGVESDGALPSWLRPGRHLGVIVRSATFTLGRPH
ncbi:MAG: acetoacetate decarboxylase family protein [Jatrophihabitans sp.]|uniref:acetoacetate decarboxylase family protein n=1 Tax=Jatrophihabitans sp. TaxID=1932789 RepID=UPI003F7D8651